METVTASYAAQAPAATATDRVISLLKATYGLVPIVAGADKFFQLLTNWKQYLAPAIGDFLPLSPGTFMGIVGIVEIVAGLLVLIKPKVGSLIVGCWLLAIALNLLLAGQYYDVAVRDIVMAIGAFSLSLLLRARREE